MNENEDYYDENEELFKLSKQPPVDISELNKMPKKADFHFLYIIENEHGGRKVSVNTSKLADFFIESGYRIVHTLDNQDILVKKNEFGILKEYPTIQLERALKTFIRSADLNEADKETYITYLDTNRTLDCFRILRTDETAIINQKRLLDKENEVYLYFLNACLKITSESYEIVTYDKLQSAIFESQVIPITLPSDFNPNTKLGGLIENFISKVCQNKEGVLNADMLKRLEYCLAKLVHTNQSQANLRIMLFTDHTDLESVSQGRSGKSLVVKLLSAFRPELAMLDGKAFDVKDKFCFQAVTPKTNIVCLDDIGRRFDIESLYSAVIDGLTIEKKFRDSFRLSARDTQIVITANREIVRDIGDSTKARIIQVEFGHYFNEKRTPLNVFGKILLEKDSEGKYKDNEEYLMFLAYMVKLIQKYLKNTADIPNVQFSENCQREKALQILGNSTMNSYIEHCQAPTTADSIAKENRVLFGENVAMADIYDSYLAYCNVYHRYSKYRIDTLNGFSQRLLAYFESLPNDYEVKKHKRTRISPKVSYSIKWLAEFKDIVD